MLIYWIWFAELPNLQLWQKHILLEHFHDPEELYHASAEALSVIDDITDDIIKALQNNWEGYEELRAIIIKKGDFFGNDTERSNYVAQKLYKSLYDFL